MLRLYGFTKDNSNPKLHTTSLLSILNIISILCKYSTGIALNAEFSLYSGVNNFQNSSRFK